MKKIFVLDTSVCLASANAVYSFGKDDVCIPLKVLEEVDKHKNRQDGVGQNARMFIKILDELRDKGSLQEGVRLQKGKGFLRSIAFTQTDFPTDLDLSVPDHVIIATAFGAAKAHQDKKVVVVSRDINMRVICDSIGLGSQDYDANQVITDSSELYSGICEMVVDDEFIERHNKLQMVSRYGHLERINYGVKFYGTVYVRIVKIEEFYLDENEEEQVNTNIYPQKDDFNWNHKLEIFDELLIRLYKFLPDSLYNIDVELTFNKNGV